MHPRRCACIINTCEECSMIVRLFVLFDDVDMKYNCGEVSYARIEDW